jgi:hypothetical protein
VRLDKPEGNVVSSVSITPCVEAKWSEISAPVNNTSGKHDIYIVYVADAGQQGGSVNLNWIYFHNIISRELE